MQADLSARRQGVNFHPDADPLVRVWAPYARKLSLEVEGKAALHLQKKDYGFWEASCPGLQAGDRYVYNINNKNRFPDPASLSQPGGVHEASECIDLQEIRKIRDLQWQGIPLQELVIYELHVGTFTPEGNFEAAAQKLDYLVELGINAIEIMPVAAFPGSRNWGYDGVFPFAVQQSYGGAKAFAELVRACHNKGIAVILDVVYNHLGPEGNYLNAYGPYFTGKYHTPWGKAVNFDDAWCDGVRNYFLENALMWLRDFHVDGLRLDAVHAIKDMSPRHFLRELSEHVAAFNEQSGSRHFLIGECDLNDTRYITPAGQGGFGLDAQWCDEWHHALHALLTGERQGYYADFGGLEHLCKSFNHAWVYNGNYSPHRKKFYGTPTTDQPGERFVVFTQNHDQVGNRMKGDRLGTMLDPESLKLAAGAMLTSPFLPMLFMGEEYAEDSPFLFFISHGDPHLLKQTRKGRKREFRDFIKNAEPPDPAAEETFEASKLKWNWHEDIGKQQMLAFYKKLISIRKQEPLLTPGNRSGTHALGVDGHEGLLLYRKGNDETLVAVMNFAEKAIVVPLENLSHKKPSLLLYSAHALWGGPVNNDATPLIADGDGLSVKAERRSIALFKMI